MQKEHADSEERLKGLLQGPEKFLVWSSALSHELCDSFNLVNLWMEWCEPHRNQIHVFVGCRSKELAFRQQLREDVCMFEHGNPDISKPVKTMWETKFFLYYLFITLLMSSQFLLLPSQPATHLIYIYIYISFFLNFILNLFFCLYIYILNHDEMIVVEVVKQ